MTTKLQLNKKNKQLYKVLRFIVFIIFIAGSIYFACRILFPSEYFTQSFQNMNSLKNTLTDTTRYAESISFFASTSQSFSEIKIDIELENNSSPLDQASIELKKSYKSFFYPEASFENHSSKIIQNLLVSSADSYYIVGGGQKSPIDNPLTLLGLGYDFDSREKEVIDLSTYEKKKLLNITSSHPNGTILHTDSDEYYLIENQLKKNIDISLAPYIKNFKNNISVQIESLALKETCQLNNNFIFKRRYACTISTDKIARFSGKDYRFEIFGISEDVKIKEINIEFKKALNQDNLFIFLTELKSRIVSRFTGEKL